MTKPKSRMYPVPQAVREELNVDSVTLDEVELLASACDGVTGTWARKLALTEARKTFASFFGETTDLPHGLADIDDSGNIVVTHLLAGGRTWNAQGWTSIQAAAICSLCGGSHHAEYSPRPASITLDAYEDYYEREDDENDVDDSGFIKSLEQALGLAEDALELVEEEREIDLSEDETLESAEQYENDDQCPVCGAHKSTGKQPVELTMGDVAAIIRAFNDGAQVVIFKPFTPIAHFTSPMVSAVALDKPNPDAKSVGISELPQGSKIVAIVDELDKNAVIELLGVAPGPVVYIRHNKSWVQDESWRKTLTGIAPPPTVSIDNKALADEIIAQVDAFDPELMKKQAAEELAAEEQTGKTEASATALVSALQTIKHDSENAALIALVAASPAKKLASKAANKAAGAERLRQYWGYGKGAAKIRWGTPGDWRRCVRQLSKYLGPRAKGYCNLMHGRVTGMWPNSKPQIPNPATSARALAKQLEK